MPTVKDITNVGAAVNKALKGATPRVAPPMADKTGKMVDTALSHVPGFASQKLAPEIARNMTPKAVQGAVAVMARPQIGVVGKTLGGATSAFGRVTRIAITGGMISAALMGAGKILPRWMGSKLFTHAGNLVNIPVNIVQQNSVADIGHAGSGILKKAGEVTGKVLGEKAVSAFDAVAAPVAAVEQVVGKGISTAAKSVANPVGDFTAKALGGRLSTMAERPMKKAESAFVVGVEAVTGMHEAVAGKDGLISRAADAAGKAKEAVSGGVSGMNQSAYAAAQGSVNRHLRFAGQTLETLVGQEGIVARLSKMAEKASGGAFKGRARKAMLTELSGTIRSLHGKEFQEVRGDLLKIHRELRKGNQMDAGVITTGLEKAKTLLGGLAEQHIGADGAGYAALKETLTTAAGHSKAAGANISDAAEKLSKAEAIKHIPDSIKGVPEAISKMSIADAALKGGAIAGTALNAYHNVSGARANIATLKHVYADLTGTPIHKVSTMKVMFGDAPAIVKDARKTLMMEFGPKLVMDTVSGIVNYRMMSGGSGKGMFAAMMATAGLGKIHSTMFAGKQVLPMYRELTLAMQHGEQITPEHYAGFICTAHEGARSTATGAENPIVVALAKEYAELQASPAEILQEIHSGKFDERSWSVREKLGIDVAAQEAAPAAEAGREALMHARANKPVEGDFTRNIVEKARQQLATPAGQVVRT